MASEIPKGPGNSSSSSAQNNTPRLLLLRSGGAQRAFVAKSMEALERLGQQDDNVDATTAMDVGFQIESDATHHEFCVIASAARALSMQAAELYLRHDAPIASHTLKSTVDVLSVLLLRVYLTGTDVDSNSPASHRATSARLTAYDRVVH